MHTRLQPLPPQYKDHLTIKTTLVAAQRWSLYQGSTVLYSDTKNEPQICPFHQNPRLVLVLTKDYTFLSYNIFHNNRMFACRLEVGSISIVLFGTRTVREIYFMMLMRRIMSQNYSCIGWVSGYTGKLH